MAKVSLRNELIRIRDHYHTQKHPFFDLWSTGKLDHRQMGYYLIQHGRMTRDGLRAYGLCYVKAPKEVQGSIMSNLAEEMGAKGIRQDAQAVEHASLVALWIQECGYSKADADAIESVAGAEAIRHCWMHLAYQYPWAVFLSAMTVLESQEVGIQSRTVPALLSHYGYKKGDPRIHFFEEHYEADQIHGNRNFVFLDKYVNDPHTMSDCIEHAEAICKLRWQYMNEIHRFVVQGQPDGLPPRPARSPLLLDAA